MIRNVILAALALVCASAPAEARRKAHDPGCNVIFPCDFSYGSPAKLREAIRVARGKYVARQLGIGGPRP